MYKKTWTVSLLLPQYILSRLFYPAKDGQFSPSVHTSLASVANVYLQATRHGLRAVIC
jgi:hypothetical protein